MSIFGDLLGTVIDVASLPVAVIKDTATMCGALTDEDEPYTVTKVKDVCKDLSNVEHDLRDL